MKRKVTAVIPIRKGSQRVSDKNLRSFAGTSLLKLKIDALKQVKCIDNIIVNTDSEEAIRIAKECSVDYHVRDAYYASSACSGSDFFEHLGLVTDTEVFAYCPVTTPFIKVSTIEACVSRFLEGNVYDSVTTVTDIKDFLWKDNQPLNYSLENAPNSQDLPEIKALNFGISLINKTDLVSFKNIIGKRPLLISTTNIESLDIDTPLDFFLAEQIYIKTVLDNKDLLEE